MPVSEAQRKASRKYDARTYKEIRIKPRIEEAMFIKDNAEQRGLSLTRYVMKAVLEYESNNPLINTITTTDKE